MTLTTIPRASTPSCITYPNNTQNVGNVGTKITIHMNRASTSFTHTVTYSFGSKSGTIGTGVGDNIEWTIPKNLANAIPSASSGSGTITCVTYSGSTNIGSKSIPFTVTVPTTDEFKPTISSIALSEAVSGLASKFGCYVKGKSKISGTVTASGAYSSTITAYKVTINGATYNAKTFTTGVLSGTGSKSCSVTVTDSRGRTFTKSVNYTVVDYSSPYITTFTVVRCNSSGTVSENGAYAKVVVKGGVSSVNSKNSYSYKLEYKKTTASSYTNYSISNSAYTIDKTYTNIAVDTDSSYEFRLTISDYFSSAPKTVTLSSVFQLMNYNSSGKGLALGKVSEGNKFECDLEAEFNKTTKFKNQVTFGTKFTSKALTSKGWYRVAKWGTSYCGCFTMNLYTNYNYTNNCSFIIGVNLAYKTGRLNQISGHENTANVITEVRLVLDSADSTYYLEIYYNQTVNNTVYVELNTQATNVTTTSFEATTSTSSNLHSIALQPGVYFTGQFIYTPVRIPASANLNSYTTVGEYYSPANADVSTMSNCPTTQAFSLTVKQHAGKLQSLTTYNTNRILKYERNLYGETWGSWKRIYTKYDLYNNSSGTNGTITLSDDASNYHYLEIFYTDNQKAKNKSVKVYSPNNKIVDLSIIGGWKNSNAPNTDIRTRGIKISGTSITTYTDSSTSSATTSYLQFSGTGIGYHSNDNHIYITRVEGHA